MNLLKLNKVAIQPHRGMERMRDIVIERDFDHEKRGHRGRVHIRKRRLVQGDDDKNQKVIISSVIGQDEARE